MKRIGEIFARLRGAGLLCITVLSLILAAPAFAQGSSPWENPVNVLQQAFTSTIARGLSLVAIVVSGLTFAFGEGGSKRVLAGVLFGVGMAIAAVKFNSRHFGVEDLVQTGTMERWLVNRMESYVLGRKNILIAGGTGTGKTSLLNVLGGFIPSDERVVLIEDTSEIHLTQDNLVRFEARQAENDLPPITIRDLLKAALRHRPDRLIIGEIRGSEAFDLLQLLNTGHSGSLSTVHAASARQGLARFTSCVLQSGIEIPYRSVKANVGDSVNVVVHLERRPGRRLVSEVIEINGYDPDRDEYNCTVVFERNQETQ
jgi:Flp pilus assembly CpaF family ATPase